MIKESFKTFTAGNLEVMREDMDYPNFPLNLTYTQIESLDLSEFPGWRLPTDIEIKYLYKLVNCGAYTREAWNSQRWSIGGFGDNSYWAKKENGDFILFDFLGGSLEVFSKGRLRLVRDL